MDLNALDQTPKQDDYLFGRGPAWFALAMTLALMIFDYVDRQVIVSLFPYLKAEWHLSDTQLGALVSVVSITVALGALPVALFADRVSRVKSIVAMAAVGSLATLWCLWARGYGALLGARAMVGLGEAGYGSVGAAVIASHFPSRLRGAHRSITGFAETDHGAGTEQRAVATRPHARHGRDAPHRGHCHDALHAADTVGEERYRQRTESHRDGHHRHEGAELLVREVPFGLQVGEQGYDDLAIDIVEDHQRQRHPERKPGLAAAEQIAVLRRRLLDGIQIHGGFLQGTSTVAPVVRRDSSAR